MSWKRAGLFALVVVVALLVLRSACSAPGYDERRHVRRPWWQPSSYHRGKPPAPRVTGLEVASPAGSNRAQQDDDMLDESREVGTWSPPGLGTTRESEPSCPPDMVEAEGEYCPNPEQVCVEWLDEGAPFLPQHRCARFRAPSRCLSDQRVYMRFCVDTDEHGDPATGLPDRSHSWTMATQVCEAEGKRLCTESEWVFACEGDEMRPYPTGFTREPTLCNFDQTALMDPTGKLRDLRKSAFDLRGCTSPFGVRNMVGNIDEWVVREGPVHPPFRSALKGGWWMAARNRCRPATTAHDEHYTDRQTGFRCCRDAQ